MSDDTLIRKDGGSLTGTGGCESYKKKLTAVLNGRVERAYFFNGFAGNGVNDRNLILVMHTEMPFTQRKEEFSDLLELWPTLSLLVYTPKEFERLFEAPSPGFWKSVSRTMVQLL